MKKIRMNSISSGPDGVMHMGQEYTVAAAMADELIKGGYATEMLVNPKPVVQMEKAVVTPAETRKATAPAAAPAAPATWAAKKA